MGIILLGSVARADPSAVESWQACVGHNLKRVIGASRDSAKKIGHADIVAATGIIQSRVSEIGQGLRPISITQGLTLASFLAVDPAWLLCFDDLRARYDDDPGRLAAQRKSLNRFYYGVAEYALSLPESRRTPGRAPEWIVEKVPANFREAWNVSVGRRLERLLKERQRGGDKITLADIQTAVGIVPSQISEFTKGKKLISLPQSDALASFLGVSVDWLLDFDMLRAHYGSDPRKLSKSDPGVSNAFYEIARHALESTSAPDTPNAASRPTAPPVHAVPTDATCERLLRDATTTELVKRLEHLGWDVSLERRE